MMRIPTSEANPTFDDTFAVSFATWLRSDGPTRGEWRRRRDIAAQVARRGQDQRANARIAAATDAASARVVAAGDRVADRLNGLAERSLARADQASDRVDEALADPDLPEFARTRLERGRHAQRIFRAEVEDRRGHRREDR